MFEESEPQLPVGFTFNSFLRLESTRGYFRKADRWPLWARFMYLGLLVWIEEALVSNKAASAVQEALEALPEEPAVVAPPIYTEKPPSPTSGGLPSEMRLRAPWVKE